MKQFKSKLLVSFILLLAIACKENENKSSNTDSKKETISVEKLSASFDSAWNQKDSTGVISLLTDDAVLLSGRMAIIGKDSLIKHFVLQQMPITNNLKVKFLQTGSNENIAYEAGTWTMQVAIPGKTPFDQSGNYTFIWKKQTDGKWKVSLLEIENYPPLN